MFNMWCQEKIDNFREWFKERDTCHSSFDGQIVKPNSTIISREYLPEF